MMTSEKWTNGSLHRKKQRLNCGKERKIIGQKSRTHCKTVSQTIWTLKWRQ